MTTRALIRIGVMAMAVGGLLKFVAIPVHSQASVAKSASLKTPWGEPDFQGIWTDVYQTPFERPAKFADKEYFTEQERVALDRQRAGILRRDFRGKKGTEEDVAGAY